VENTAVNIKTAVNGKFNVELIRKDFPILDTQIHGKHLCYFDNAATTQKPQSVIDAIDNYYKTLNSNIHRGVHTLSEAATAAYEQSRVKIQKFLNAASEKEIIFTSGTTASINMVAQTFGRQNIGEGDEIVISHMEHHSNIVPWQLLAKEKKALLKVIPISDAGELDIDAYKKLVTNRTKIVSVVYVSNSLGTINPVEEIIQYAHSFNIPVLIDGAQAVNHFPVDVQKLDCDFLALSGHKLFGPTGIGVLYGKKTILESMPPFMGGGDMISKVTFEETTFNELPYKFEAGTPNIEGVIGFGAAIDYINKIGLINIQAYEKELFEYALNAISSIKGLNVIGTAKNKCSVISFTLDNIHPHDVGTFLDFEGIAIRTGHHCTQPVMQRYNIPATSRVSLSFYNTKEEVDILVNGIKKVIEVFG
jgi:cysteine desulfurase / selenocysteine lyase